MRFVWLTWSFMTWLSAMLCGGGCLLPYWLRGSFHYNKKESFSDLGLFRRCVYPVRSLKESIRLISDCGYYEFDDVPHIYWKVCLVMIGVSTCTLFFLTFLLFILGFCLDLLKIDSVHRSCQIGQFSAGVLVLVSCILYPMGWHSNTEVLQICGPTASIMSLGRCHVGWAFVLTCAGGLVAILSTTVPALLLKNNCNNSTNDNRHSSRHKAPSNARDSIRYSTDVTSFRPPSQNFTTGTRYSYVSYQSLQPPHIMKSGNSIPIPRDDPTFRHSTYLQTVPRVMLNNTACNVLQPTASSDCNKSTTSNKDRNI